MSEESPDYGSQSGSRLAPCAGSVSAGAAASGGVAGSSGSSKPLDRDYCSLTPYYRDAFCTIYHADALSVLAQLASESVDVFFTDPPYSSGARNAAMLRSRGSMRRNAEADDSWIANDNLTAHGFAMLVRMLAVETLRVARRDAHFFSFIDWRQLPVIQGAIEASGWSPRALLVWDKVHYGMGNGFRQQAEFLLHASKGVGDNFLRHDLGTVFREKRQADSIGHPTVKPIGLVREALSAVPGLIVDPFCGSATTLVAAKELGRFAIGIEIEEKYCEIGARRLQEVMNFAPAQAGPAGLQGLLVPDERANTNSAHTGASQRQNKKVSHRSESEAGKQEK